ncbi:MAG: hypothetical protein HY288_12785 [Planctomycetia bacterium]|nr:hypothetical protein [Planctomycetia bacterium]
MSTIPFGAGDHALVDVFSVAHPVLTAGTLYWIEATNVPQGSQPGTDGGWNFNNQADASHVAVRFGNGAWQPAGTNVAFLPVFHR